MKAIINSKTSGHKAAIKLLSALALAAAIQFSPSKLAAEMGLRGGSAIPTSAIGVAPASPIGTAPSTSSWSGRSESGDRDSARAAIRQIEADARELYNASARELRNGSRDEINALNRVNDLQRAAYELTMTLDRRDASPEITDRHYRAFETSYAAARGSWGHLGRVRGARDYTVRIERCYTPVRGFCGTSHAYLSWHDVRRMADDIEDAAEHLYDVAYRESKEYCDYRTRESRRAALEHVRELREVARDFDREVSRSGSDPRYTRHDFYHLTQALDCARGAVRAFGHHAQDDFRDVSMLVYRVQPYYAEKRAYGHGHDHDYDNGHGYGRESSWGGDRDYRGSSHTSIGGSIRVIGSSR